MTAPATGTSADQEAGPSDSMRYRRLGRSGLQVSAVSLGTWATIGESVDERLGLRILDAAYAAGVNLLDTAETYGDGRAELALGGALRRLKWPRETYAVCAKVFWGVHGGRPTSRGLSRKHVIEGAHASLRRLGLDHLDILLCHRPDPDTPVEETVRAMSDLVTAGTILYWGTSEWSPDQVAGAIVVADRVGGHRPVTEQLRHNLLSPDRVRRDFGPLISRTGLGVMAWSPLAYGLLAGRYQEAAHTGRLSRAEYAWLREDVFGDAEADVLDRVRAFGVLAADAGLPPAVLALAWVLRDPVVSTAICGASTVRQMETNVRAGAGVDLDPALWQRIERLFCVADRCREDEREQR
jgi:voltage-dependent potassium channel beta subunit